MPVLRHVENRDDAGRRLPVLLRLYRLRHTVAAETGRLLCILLVWNCPVPTASSRRRESGLLRIDRTGRKVDGVASLKQTG
jgi:hypothetical protein